MIIRIVLVFNLLNILVANCYILGNKYVNSNEYFSENNTLEEVNKGVNEESAADAFNGVYSECFFRLSYTCIQKKTLLYLYELNRLKEVSILGNHLKFVKINTTNADKENEYNTELEAYASTHDLSVLIDKAVDHFFDKHVLRITALGKDISVPRTVDEFVGRKRRKGGGGGGGGGDGGGHHDGGKKKMMMMAMMCMKMKLMMMIPAMMGMMGMMSFKGMMFSMMSFMIAKMMLLMKILEKKNGGGGGGAGDGGGWAAGGGAGGAWMPAGQDYGGNAGGGGGYDANGQWQSRSIPTQITENFHDELDPILNHNIKKFLPKTNLGKSRRRRESNKGEKIKDKLFNQSKVLSKSRKRRGILDILQNAYTYWANQILGYKSVTRPNNLTNMQKFKVVNGVKYVYYPMKYLHKPKTPKALQPNSVTINEEVKPMVAAEDFNKGEIMEGGFESRMQKKKFNKLKETVNDALEESPWQ